MHSRLSGPGTSFSRMITRPVRFNPSYASRSSSVRSSSRTNSTARSASDLGVTRFCAARGMGRGPHSLATLSRRDRGAARLSRVQPRATKSLATMRQAVAVAVAVASGDAVGLEGGNGGDRHHFRLPHRRHRRSRRVEPNIAALPPPVVEQADAVGQRLPTHPTEPEAVRPRSRLGLG